MWTDKIRSGRCYLEDTCVMDHSCPYLASCGQDTEPMGAIPEDTTIDRLLADIFGSPRLSWFRRFWLSLRAALG